MPSLRPHPSATEKLRSSAASVRDTPQLPSAFARSTDDKAQFVLGWWHRMHSGRRALIAVALKPVVWRAEGIEPERCIWEVCKWPQRGGFVWHFVCWSLDGVGAWWKAFPSRRAAMAYYRQPPHLVMARPQTTPALPSADDGVREGVRCAAAS